MNEEIQKSLVNLIDESLAELEELKKSDRFAASEVSIGDSKSGIKDKDKNGSLDKDEDKDDKKDDDAKEVAEKEVDEHNEKKHGEDKDEDSAMDKAEGKNSEADPNAGSHQVVAKGEDMEKMEERMSKMESMLASMSKKEDKDEDDKKEDKKDEDKEEMKKSEETTETLMKSYVDEKFSSIESKFDTIAKMVQELADSPVPSKSVSYKDVQPLAKSEEPKETLSKSSITDKLLELKKSGTNVNSEDITAVELGGPEQLSKIVEKYNIQ